MMILVFDPSRFSRIQPIAPVVIAGGDRLGWVPGAYVCCSLMSVPPYLSTSFIFLLYQFINADIKSEKNRYNASTMVMHSISRPV